MRTRAERIQSSSLRNLEGSDIFNGRLKFNSFDRPWIFDSGYSYWNLDRNTHGISSMCARVYVATDFRSWSLPGKPRILHGPTDMATPYSPTTIARFHTRLKLVWGQTDVGKGWLASQPWPAAVGRPCAAVRFLASERTEMLFSLIELSARGSTLKARCFPPPPSHCPLSSPVPLPLLSPAIHASPSTPLSLSLLFSFTRWILPDPSLLSLCLRFRGKARVSTSPGSCLCRARVSEHSIPDTCTIYSNNARAFWSYPRWKLNVALLLYDSYKRDHRSRFLVIETILIVESWSCSRRGRDREPVSLGLNDIYLGANHATVRLFVGMRGNANGEAARQDQRHSYWTRRKRWIFMPPCRGEHRRQQGAKRR